MRGRSYSRDPRAVIPLAVSVTGPIEASSPRPGVSTRKPSPGHNAALWFAVLQVHRRKPGVRRESNTLRGVVKGTALTGVGASFASIRLPFSRQTSASPNRSPANSAALTAPSLKHETFNKLLLPPLVGEGAIGMTMPLRTFVIGHAACPPRTSRIITSYARSPSCPRIT